MSSCGGKLVALRVLSPSPFIPWLFVWLALSGDLSPWGVGTFFEGVMTTGYTSDDADAAVQMDIAKANYQKL